MHSRRLAFVGLGIMGGAMAANLAAAGHKVSAWNRTPGRPGAMVAQNAGCVLEPCLHKAVSLAEVVFVCVGNDLDVDELVLGENGIADSAEPGTLVVDMTTTGPLLAKRLHEELLARKLRFLDAPVTGGDVGARNGTLTIMVGGDEEDFRQCKPLLACLGKTVCFCGPAGSGQAVKLCNQVLCAVNMVAVCEAVQLALLLGVDPNLVVHVCATGAGGSWALANLGPRLVGSDFKPGFMLDHMIKDLRLVHESLSSTKISLPGFELADRQFCQARDQGSGSQGTQAMILSYRGK